MQELVAQTIVLTLVLLNICQHADFVSSLDINDTSASSSVRLCVTQNDYPSCIQMVGAVQGTLGCVVARDRYECMRLIIEGQADVANLDNEELYLAGRLYNLEPFAMEQIKGGTQYHQSVVIVSAKSGIKSISDLRGKRSCHGALNSTSGWDEPIGLLLATLTMVPDCRGELHTAERFFDSACAPGPWSADPFVNNELKRSHQSLCAACQDPIACSANDEFYGDEGALKCLFSGRGDVAFTTFEAIERFLGLKRDPRLVNQYEYLCLDGSRVSLDRLPCQWAIKPTNTFVVAPNRSRQQKDQYLRVLQHLFLRFSIARPQWWRMRSFISDPNAVTQIVSVPSTHRQWDKYLGNFISSIEKPLPGCEPSNVSICAPTPFDRMKCLDLQKVAFARRVRPEIECRESLGRLDCIEMLHRNAVDMYVADDRDMLETPPEVRNLVEKIAVSHPTNGCNKFEFPAKMILVPRIASREKKLMYRRMSVWLSDKFEMPLRPNYEGSSFNSQLLSSANALSSHLLTIAIGSVCSSLMLLMIGSINGL